MEHQTFHYNTLDALQQEMNTVGVSLPLSTELERLQKPLTVQGKRFANSMAIQPMEGCDGTRDGRPDTLTERRYERFAKSGVGLIWVEAVAVVQEGRANPRQLFMNEKTLDSFKRLVQMIKETCLQEHGFEPVVIMQATHSGRYSKPNGKLEPIIAYQNPIFEKDTPISPERIITDDALMRLEERFGSAAKEAEMAGFDGIDIKCCHRYLNNELLSAFNRPGAFGGSFENRTRLLRNGIQNAQAATRDAFMVTSRLNVYDGFPYPYGFGVSPDGGVEPDLTEGIRLAKLLQEEAGLSLLDITIGNPYVNPHVNRPFDGGPYVPQEHPLEGVARMVRCVGEIQKACPKLAIVSSGNSYLRQFAPMLAAGMLEEGLCAIAGFGREACAYPDFYRDIVNSGAMDPAKCCITCGKCSELMRAGTVAGCVIRDKDVYLPIYRRDVLKK